MFSVIQKYLIYALAAALAASLIACGYYYLRCGSLKNQLGKAQQERTNFEAAAKINKATADALQLERDNMTTRYTAQLATCQKKITGLQKIDTLSEVETHETTTVTHSGNPILDALNGLFPALRTSDNSQGICQAAGPAPGAGADVLPGNVVPPLPSRGEGRGEGWYCLDAVGAKNLLKNIFLMRGWGQESAEVLQSFQTGTARGEFSSRGLR